MVSFLQLVKQEKTILESKKTFRRRKEQYTTVMIKKAINMKDNKNITDFSNRLNQTITQGYKKSKNFEKKKKKKKKKKKAQGNMN